MKIDRFHVLSLLLGILIGGLGVFFVSLALGNTPNTRNNEALQLYPPTSSEVKSDWLVKIDNYAIPQKEFQELYAYTIQTLEKQGRDLSQMPESTIKAQLLESLIGQYAIVIQALKDGVVSEKNSRNLLKMQLDQAIQQLYLQKLMPTDRSQFIPSKVEISQFYEQNKSELAKRGYSAKQIKELATKELFNRKTQAWIQKTVEEIKEKYKIERNSNLIQKLGIGSLLPENQNGLTSPLTK